MLFLSFLLSPSSPFSTFSLPSWKQYIRKGMRKMVQWGIWAVGMKMKKEGIPDKKVTMMVANGQSIMDVLLVFACTECVPFVGEEMRKIAVVGVVLEAVQAIVVERNSVQSKVAGVEELMRRTTSYNALNALHLLAKDGVTKVSTTPLLVFPETVATNGRALLTFKNTPFAGGVPVQPVAIKYLDGDQCPCMNNIRPGYPNSIFSPDLKSSSYLVSCIWFFRLICCFQHSVVVSFLPVYTPNAEESLNTRLFASNVRNIMAAKLQVQRTAHCYNDVLLLIWSELNTTAPTIVELRKQFGVTVNELPKLLSEFDKNDKNKDGMVSYFEFCQSLKINPNCSYSGAVFDLLDCDDTGLLDFREFVVGMFSPKFGTLNAKLEFCFRYDSCQFILP